MPEDTSKTNRVDEPPAPSRDHTRPGEAPAPPLGREETAAETGARKRVSWRAVGLIGGGMLALALMWLLVIGSGDEDASEWVMFGGDPARTGASPGPGIAGEPTERWRFTTGGTRRSSPVVAGGVVYVGSRDGGLYALDADSGAERWRFTAGDERVGVESSAAVVDGVVYFGTAFLGGGAPIDHQYAVYALDAKSGTERWQFTTPSQVLSSPAVVGGVVYVGSHEGPFYALDADTGAERWRFAANGFVVSPPAVAGGVVYVGSLDGDLYALDANSGAERWRFQQDGGVDSVAVADTTVYVSMSFDGVDRVDNTLHALDADSGAERWRFTTDGGFGSSPAVADGVVFFGTHADGGLYALDADSGAERWRFTVGDDGVSSPTVAGGVVYVGSLDDGLYALDAASGAERWRFTTDGGVWTSPALADGVVYFASEDGTVYALSS